MADCRSSTDRKRLNASPRAALLPAFDRAFAAADRAATGLARCVAVGEPQVGCRAPGIVRYRTQRESMPEFDRCVIAGPPSFPSAPGFASSTAARFVAPASFVAWNDAPHDYRPLAAPRGFCPPRSGLSLLRSVSTARWPVSATHPGSQPYLSEDLCS